MTVLRWSTNIFGRALTAHPTVTPYLRRVVRHPAAVNTGAGPGVLINRKQGDPTPGPVGRRHRAKDQADAPRLRVTLPKRIRAQSRRLRSSIAARRAWVRPILPGRIVRTRAPNHPVTALNGHPRAPSPPPPAQSGPIPGATRHVRGRIDRTRPDRGPNLLPDRNARTRAPTHPTRDRNGRIADPSLPIRARILRPTLLQLETIRPPLPPPPHRRAIRLRVTRTPRHRAFPRIQPGKRPSRQDSSQSGRILIPGTQPSRPSADQRVTRLRHQITTAATTVPSSMSM